jgi:cystathionine beta-lyase
VAAALGGDVSLVWLETPSNPRLRLADVAAIAALLRGSQALLAVDNSILSPLAQRPLELGADLAVQSATKLLGGHGDLTAGVVSVRDAALAERLAFGHNAEGSALGPFESWLLLRGLDTLAVRLRRQQESAARLSAWLAEVPGVRRLYAAPRSCVISLDTGEVERSRALLASLRLFRTTVSFGGVTSSASLPCEMSHASVPAAWRGRVDLPPSLVRLSIGLEDAGDLEADLAQALEAAGERLPLAAVAR